MSATLQLIAAPAPAVLYMKFTVYGVPAPQGSARAFVNPKTGKAFVTGFHSGNAKLKPWRQEVSATAKAVMDDAFLLPLKRDVPVQLNVMFYFPRPASLPKRVRHKVTKPDFDKLARAVADSLTGSCFEDDSQIVKCWIEKRFDGTPRAEIEIWKIG